MNEMNLVDMWICGVGVCRLGMQAVLFEGGNHKDKAIGTLYRNFESPPKSDDVKKKST